MFIYYLWLKTKVQELNSLLIFLHLFLPLCPYAVFSQNPGRLRFVTSLWIIITHASVWHQLHRDCVSSWLVPTLAGFSLCHLALVSCPPSCYVASTHSKQLGGTNSEKPKLWVIVGKDTSELTVMSREQARSLGQ